MESNAMKTNRIEIEEFSKYQLRVGLDLILRYEGLGPSITRVLRLLTESCESHTVVHVHFDVPVEETVLDGAEVYEMSGVVGLLDKELGHSDLFAIRVLENHVTDCNDQPLRRLDIHYDHQNRRMNKCST